MVMADLFAAWRARWKLEAMIVAAIVLLVIGWTLLSPQPDPVGPVPAAVAGPADLFGTDLTPSARTRALQAAPHPDIQRRVLSAIVLGLLLAAAVTALLEWLDPRVRTAAGVRGAALGGFVEDIDFSASAVTQASRQT